MRSRTLPALALLVASVMPAGASTLTVTGGPRDAAAFALLDLTSTAALPSGASFGVALESIRKTGNLDGQWRSPFDPSHGVSIAGWDALPYFSVGLSTVPSATLSFSGLQSGLSMLWGSIDSYNGVTFCNSRTGDCASTDASPLGWMPGAGAQLVSFSGFLFDSVTFESHGNAFEFAGLEAEAAAIPLPATGLLLVGGIAAFAAFRRYR